MFKIALANQVAAFFPTLKRDLRIAHLPYSAVEYTSKNLKSSIMVAPLFTILFFFVLKKAQLPLILLLPIFIAIFIMVFGYSIISIKSKIRKREKEIDQEVLFVGRYLLVKLYSGRPLLNALIETSESRGIATKYVKEIVDDINTGSTIEDALRNAMTSSPSEKLGKILFHVNNALKLGIDVTGPLESVLEEITRNEALEIKKYGKKLNTLVIFYMLAAVIMPSLGVSIFIVITSFINFPIDLKSFGLFIFFLIILEFIFITLFRSIRPTVNL